MIIMVACLSPSLKLELGKNSEAVEEISSAGIFLFNHFSLTVEKSTSKWLLNRLPKMFTNNYY